MDNFWGRDRVFSFFSIKIISQYELNYFCILELIEVLFVPHGWSVLVNVSRVFEIKVLCVLKQRVLAMNWLDKVC